MVLDPDNLRLTDFLDLSTLQEIQDSFASVANVKATITDAAGNVITQAMPTKEFLRRQRAIADASGAADETLGAGPQKEGREFVAPIVVDNQRLGTLRMTANPNAFALDDAKLTALAEKFGLDAKQTKQFTATVLRAKNNRAAALQFLYMLANAIARLCYQEYQLRQRIHELTAVYNVTTLLAESRHLEKVLQRAVQVVCEVTGTQAAAIRLVDLESDEMIIKAVHNLSGDYLNKGRVALSRSEIDLAALGPNGFEYVRNLASDPRTLYPEEAHREGIASCVAVGMRYKGKNVGVLRVYTATEQDFPPAKIDLLKAVAAQAAAAIENARLADETAAAENLDKQIKLAVEVQQRMIPQTPPVIEGLELAAIYVPCFELGGDFYDFIPLPEDNVGLVIADVSGKGLPASLIMASVRASLRAQVDNVYYLYEMMRRLNISLHRDTRPSEFVTLFYGVYDSASRRLTYCSAGHPPGLLLRNGQVTELVSDDMILGVNPEEEYSQSIIDLQPGDTLLLYTDGLFDAANFQDERFGRQRVLDAFAMGGETADVVAQNVLWHMRRFVGLTKRTDDVTMIVAKVT